MLANAAVSRWFELVPSLRTRGFLPAHDPLTHFPIGSPLEVLDSIGKTLPEALKHNRFRHWASHLDIPDFPVRALFDEETMRELRLYYVRTHFLASAYVHQIGQETATHLSRNIVKAVMQAAQLLDRRPILSYDGYALYNWHRIDPEGPIALGNIDTTQNFVDLESAGGINQESWFILVHIEIEVIAAQILDSLARFVADEIGIDTLFHTIRDTVHAMRDVLLRIPEHMDSNLYYSKFRPYIYGFFKGVVYEGVSEEPKIFRGETGAQSSIMPLLEAFLKIPHKATGLTELLADMRNYMPIKHQGLLRLVDTLPPVRDAVSKDAWNEALEAIAMFRDVHLGWAIAYVDRHGDQRGTGGSPYVQWLSDLIKETRAAKKL